MIGKLYDRHVVPRLVDLTLGGETTARARRRVAAGVSGVVLEVGFGSGLNLPAYPDAVERLVAVEPSDTARKMAGKRVAAAPFPVHFVGADDDPGGGIGGGRLPVEDRSIDFVVSTFTFCTIPELDEALIELRRVLKPGGRLHFLEHGRAPDANVARWQDRLNPLQRKVAGGCNLNRAIVERIEAGGFEIAEAESYYDGPIKPMAYMSEGTAVSR